MAVTLALVCAGAYAPTTAQALETAKITARPHAGSGSDVVGGTETRITWEVQADADEELSGLSLTFVDGTTFGTDSWIILSCINENGPPFPLNPSRLAGT